MTDSIDEFDKFAEEWKAERDNGRDTATSAPSPDVNAGLRHSVFDTKPVSKKARAAGKARQRQGANSEKLAKKTLEALGMVYIRRVKTYYSRNGRYAHKAEADWRAIEAGTGRYVLAEVKDITGNTLPHSRTEQHQRANMTAVMEAGGLSLLIITKNGEAAVIRWSDIVDRFVAKTSIKWETAVSIRIN